MVVASLFDLDTKGIDSTVLKKWIPIVAQGLCAKEIGGERELQHLPAFTKSAKLHLSNAFKQKHAPTNDCIQRLLRDPACKWHAVESHERKSVHLNTLEDVREFLKSVRQLPSMAGVSANFLKRTHSAAASQRSCIKSEVDGTWPKRQRCA